MTKMMRMPKTMTCPGLISIDERYSSWKLWSPAELMGILLCSFAIFLVSFDLV